MPLTVVAAVLMCGAAAWAQPNRQTTIGSAAWFRLGIAGARRQSQELIDSGHTTSEGLDVISTPGLERIARFPAFLVSAADKGAARKD